MKQKDVFWKYFILYSLNFSMHTSASHKIYHAGIALIIAQVDHASTDKIILGIFRV